MKINGIISITSKFKQEKLTKAVKICLYVVFLFTYWCPTSYLDF